MGSFAGTGDQIRYLASETLAEPLRGTWQTHGKDLVREWKEANPGRRFGVEEYLQVIKTLTTKAAPEKEAMREFVDSVASDTAAARVANWGTSAPTLERLSAFNKRFHDTLGRAKPLHPDWMAFFYLRGLAPKLQQDLGYASSARLEDITKTVDQMAAALKAKLEVAQQVATHQQVANAALMPPIGAAGRSGRSAPAPSNGAARSDPTARIRTAPAPVATHYQTVTKKARKLDLKTPKTGASAAKPATTVGARAGVGTGYTKQQRADGLPAFDAARAQHCREKGLCFICEQPHVQTACPHRKA